MLMTLTALHCCGLCVQKLEETTKIVKKRLSNLNCPLVIKYMEWL